VYQSNAMIEHFRQWIMKRGKRNAKNRNKTIQKRIPSIFI